MKALTICQPYAHYIRTGEKRVENRSWKTSYRGPLAIHAGKSLEYLSGDPLDPDMHFGAVVAVCRLIECLHIAAIRDGQYDRLYPWLGSHLHTEGPWCLVLGDVKALDPVIPATGKLFLWDWEPTLAALSLTTDH